MIAVIIGLTSYHRDVRASVLPSCQNLQPSRAEPSQAESSRVEPVQGKCNYDNQIKAGKKQVGEAAADTRS